MMCTFVMNSNKFVNLLSRYYYQMINQFAVILNCCTMKNVKDGRINNKNPK
jgi:hypothetical protein